MNAPERSVLVVFFLVRFECEMKVIECTIAASSAMSLVFSGRYPSKSSDYGQTQAFLYITLLWFAALRALLFVTSDKDEIQRVTRAFSLC